jgi:hypothetical protein
MENVISIGMRYGFRQSRQIPSKFIIQMLILATSYPSTEVIRTICGWIEVVAGSRQSFLVMYSWVLVCD